MNDIRQICRVSGIKPFGQGYYIETVDNSIDEAVQKYIKEQAEESRKEDSVSAVLLRTSKSACDAALRGEQ